ncbi:MULTISPECIES: hypothetical protein [unclassified Streptomyces]|uniref:hypothetical protein n=1 Tax=unclassified Streptomyces TaxID=2593676 RepID=UPI002DDB9BB3|nr:MULTISPECIES: hypothetical protein [unclassified Streptomyces]WSF89269.1 hypothetical protein OIE70_43045 [Streptomyces sp. NBC_01744]WSC34560.1 hypothetical protein OHA08_02850 [Streptomyces sp. NBC_01763]WSC42970.1 hypothetical protein OIE61_02695 [Streptomyces sp. NBC_01762]WSC58168.1 hypothetical protein OG808_41495 [Streptomyces sp. NBC_01761]WSD22507.1 hypothetical protein OHA26_02755 [Streptomyces sp. NBC_01751]
MDHSHAERRRVRFEIDTSGSPVQESSAAREAVRGPEVLDVDGLGEAGAFVLAIKGDRSYAPLLL